MITIIADRHAYNTAPPGALMASATSDYVSVRRGIRVALDRAEDLIVYVTNPVVLSWLGDLQRYPESHVVWRTVDPGEIFTQLFGVSPTEPFTPGRIAALRLDSLPHPPEGALVHPLAWILGHRLDTVWQYEDPPSGHAAVLVSWAVNRSEPIDPTLTALVEAQLGRWALQAPIFQTLHATSLSEDGSQLLVRWALRNYPSDWRVVQPWGALPLLDGEPAPEAVVKALCGHREAIWSYWSRCLSDVATNNGLIATALGQMSGMSEAELVALEAMARRWPDDLDERRMDMIKRRFAELPNAEATLLNLAARVAPPKPALPDPEWSTERWLGWATQEYMPYYSWVVRTGQHREHQQLCALRYSDWLYTRYPAMLNDENSPLILGQYQEVTSLIKRDQQAVVLWLIVDGMTWWQGSVMREACERYGLYPKSVRPGIAVLPSITSISKRALVTGQPTIDLTQPTIAEASREKLARSMLSALVTYHHAEAIKALETDSQIRIVVVLYNLLDALAHQTTDFTDNAGIRGYLEEMAHCLRDAHHICAQQGRSLHIFIGSDHGGTLLPQNALSVVLPTMARAIDDIWEPEIPGQEPRKPGTRAAATDLDHIPMIDEDHWYTLDRDRFQLDRHYLVPRSYGYIKRRPLGWTHGGLSPEETVVPLIHLSGEPFVVLPVELEFFGNLRAGQAGTVTVILRNLNLFPVTKVHLLVSGGSGEVIQDHIGPSAEYKAELHFASVNSIEQALEISYEVRYHAFGTPHSDAGKTSIPLRRLQSEDTSFEDMFN